MATLHIRNVPDELVEMLRERAQREKRSLNAEVLTLLELAVRPGMVNHARLLERIDRRAERLRREGRTFDDVVELIREDRER